MDYCSTCRRHLNGALVCPGCGAYAPDIAPRTAEPSFDRDLFQEVREPEPAVFTPSGDIVDAPVAAERRAARRRQLARWKKNKRRAAVATAVALVGGGLTVSAMNRQTPDRTQADAAPDTRGMGGVEERTADVTDPTAALKAGHRTERVVTSRPVTTATPHEQTASRTTLRLVPSDSATTPTPSASKTASEAAQEQSAAAPASASGGSATPTDSGTSDSGATEPSTAPETTDPSDTSDTSNGSDTSETADPSSPAKLCLLVICLG